MNKFWNMKKDSDSIGEILLYGDISDSSWYGDEITPKAFKDELDALGDVNEINIFINSGGGDVFAGVAIYNMLKRHPAKKTVYIDGLAASIASVIAMAGDKIIMPRNAMLMIHNAWTVAMGNKSDLRKMADELENVDSMLRSVYVSRTGLDAEQIDTFMNDETWFTAESAFENSFIDEIEDAKLLAACLTAEELARYTIPKDYVSIVSAEEITEPCNGETSQPVEENKETAPYNEESALDEQKNNFTRIKRKLLGKV